MCRRPWATHHSTSRLLYLTRHADPTTGRSLTLNMLNHNSSVHRQLVTLVVYTCRAYAAHCTKKTTHYKSFWVRKLHSDIDMQKRLESESQTTMLDFGDTNKKSLCSPKLGVPELTENITRCTFKLLHNIIMLRGTKVQNLHLHSTRTPTLYVGLGSLPLCAVPIRVCVL